MSVDHLSQPATPPVLQIEQLQKSFGDKRVLQGVDLQLSSGSVLGLLGQNGSGKTTLIKCALGLLRPTAGSVAVWGEKAWHLSSQSKSQLGYVPQEFISYPWMRVRQVISYTAAFYPAWNQPLVDDLCRRWHVPLEDRVGPLSVGQLQTLGIILALGHEPQLLVLDEPVAALDPAARRQFLQVLLEILDETSSGRPRTILFSTHITSDLERIASRVAVLKEGRIAFCGELGDLKDRVKRLHFKARSGSVFPSDFAVPGALRYDLDGPIATVSVDNFASEIVDSLEETWDASVTVRDLNLEEIFVEMHHGPAS